MLRQTPGTIYLADQRGLLETRQFRRYCTFSFDTYAAEHKGPFGRLHALNEETLAGAHRLELRAPQASQVLIIPITGEVQTRTADGRNLSVHVEEVQLLSLPAGGSICFINPYEAELVTFLHLWLHAADDHAAQAPPRLLPFDLQALENRLVDITAAAADPALPPLPFSLHLGRFAGRHEAVYYPRPGGRFFAFVIAGAFELEGRLLHEKDGLALWDATEVELEALSNNALLLVLEV